VVQAEYTGIKFVPIRKIPADKMHIRFPSLFPPPRQGKAPRKWKPQKLVTAENGATSNGFYRPYSACVPGEEVVKSESSNSSADKKCDSNTAVTAGSSKSNGSDEIDFENGFDWTVQCLSDELELDWS